MLLPSVAPLGLKQGETVWSLIRTSQKQLLPLCPTAKAGTGTGSFSGSTVAGGRGSKLSSVITALVCLLAGQKSGHRLSRLSHFCTSGSISTHASRPSLYRANLGSTPPLALGRPFLYSLWGLLRMLPSHDPQSHAFPTLSLLRPTADSWPQKNWTVWP